MSEDIAKNANISMPVSMINAIDNYKVGNGYKNRSDYVQNLVVKDMKYGHWESVSDMMSKMVLPMMAFLLFLAFALYTHGLLFYILALIFGGFGVFFTFMLWKQQRKPKTR